MNKFNMKLEIISSHKDDINRILKTRHGETEDRKRRGLNIAVSNFPEHTFGMGLTNKSAGENDLKQITWHL